MRISLREVVSVLILLLSVNGQLLASNYEDESRATLPSQTSRSNIPEMPEDVWNVIFNFYNALPGEVLTLQQVSKILPHQKALQELTLSQVLGKYFGAKINILLGQMNTFKPTVSPQMFALTLSRTIDLDLFIKSTFFQRLDQLVAENPFFFVPMGSPLMPIINERYLFPESQYEQLDEYDLSQKVNVNINRPSKLSQFMSVDFIISSFQVFFSPSNSILNASQVLYETLFKCKLPIEDKEGTRTALAHLLAAWPLQGVYVKKDHKQKQQAIENFFKQYREPLINALNASCSQIPYVSFGNLPTNLNQLKNQICHIVITDEQLAKKTARDELETLLKENPQHLVILSVGENSPFFSEFPAPIPDGINVNFYPNGLVKEDGCLSLSEYDVPTSLQRLRIVNPTGNIKETCVAFLANTGLTYLDVPGFITVKKIGFGFLPKTKMISLDTSWFIHVEDIQSSFLHSCESLFFLDSTGFTSLKKFGANFLQDCPAWPIAIPGFGIIPCNSNMEQGLEDARKYNQLMGYPFDPDEQFLLTLRGKTVKKVVGVN